MPIARTFGVALTGLTGQIVEVQADLSAGLPGLTFTGLPDTSVVEARDRIRAAVLNSGAAWPNRRITLALLPADVRKAGSRFDLAMAIAILAAAGRVAAEAIADVVWIAELGLDGCLRSVRGVLPAMIAARRAGVRRVVVPSANAAEATLVDAVDVRAADTLAQVLDWLQGAGPPLPAAQPGPECHDDDRLPDLVDIAGQSSAKRALEVSAAGGHNLYFVGAAGAGKSMLAERLPGLLPALEDDVALEVTARALCRRRAPRRRSACSTSAVASSASHRLRGRVGWRRIGHRLAWARSHSRMAACFSWTRRRSSARRSWRRSGNRSRAAGSSCIAAVARSAIRLDSCSCWPRTLARVGSRRGCAVAPQ